jgi:hypothetical protein
MAVDAAVANKRRFLFGLKSVVDLVLGVAVVGFAVWASGRYGGQIDLSSGGVNSLSPRTVKLLEGLDQDITITGMFTLIASDIRPHAEKRYEYVSDLLDLYESTGGARVTTYMIDKEMDPQPARALLDRLAAKPEYQHEAEPYKALLEQFPEIEQQLAPLAQDEVSRIGQLLLDDPALESVRELPVIERNFKTILEEGEATRREVDRFMSADIPLQGQALNVIGVQLDQAAKAMKIAQDWMTREGAKLVGISPESAQYFAGAGVRYAGLIAQIEALKEKSTGLEPLQLEQIYRQLEGGQVVVVETPDAVSVVPQDDVWPARTDGGQGEDGDRREFAGEQGVSSAILRMTQKERTGVVFVRYAGGPLLTPEMPQLPQMMQQRPPEAPYESIDAAMQKENFVTAEWNVEAEPSPPVLEDVARTVFVVFPPTPPGPQSLQNPAGAKSISEEQKQAVLSAVGESGMAVFLVGWQPPAMPFGGAGGAYAYGEYLTQNWGIEPQSGALTIQFMLNPRKQETFVPLNMRNPTLLTSDAFEWTGHPIANALKSLPGALASALPLRILTGETAPEGVTLEPIIRLKTSDAVWAVMDIQRLQTDFQQHEGTRRYDDDTLPPFPLAVAGTNAAGQRIVVISSEQFIANPVLSAAQLMFVGGGIAQVQLYPANRDLFINTLHWLTGDAERIAVGPRRGNVPRLDKLEDGPVAEFTKVFLVGIWPGVVLIAGAVVWFTRRR